MTDAAIRLVRVALARALLWLCAAVDLIPWRDTGRWYLCGCRGCCWGISRLSCKVYPDGREAL
jgi:hypothetical protein